MRWQMGRRSENIEDRRGMPVGRGAAVGGGIGTLVLVLVALYFGVDPSVILQGGDPTSTGPAPSVQQRSAGDDQMRDFVSVVLADTEDTWREIFQRMGRQYQEPRLVLFSGAVQSACGFAEAAVGPSTVRGTRRCTSISRSTATCANASGPRAISRRRT
jgi:predicted metalloprotease